MLCLTGARFNMKADILRQGTATDPTDQPGEWVEQQDPDSGEIIRVWKPAVDDPNTPEDESVLDTFPCIARSIIDGGIRVQGATEHFNLEYEKVGYVRITFPATVKISERDRVTNIRNSKNHVVWKERQLDGMPPTVFEVTGITEVLDPWGNHIESMALLERAEVQ